MSKVITVYAVDQYENLDYPDSGIVAYFSSEKEAQECVKYLTDKANPSMVKYCDLTYSYYRTELVIYNSFNEFKNEEDSGE